MKEKIKELIKSVLEEYKETNGEDFNVTDESIILGDGGVLDSFSFVTFVADLEDQIADEFGKDITLVSEKAFSKKYSPFKTIDRIAEYAEELLKEAD